MVKIISNQCLRLYFFLKESGSNRAIVLTNKEKCVVENKSRRRFLKFLKSHA